MYNYACKRGANAHRKKVAFYVTFDRLLGVNYDL